MDEDIFYKVKTSESAEILKEELELLLKSLYLGSNEFSSILRTKVRSNISDYFIKKLNEEDVDIEKLIKDIILKIEKISTVRLIIAYEPTEDAIDRFYSFIVSACQKNIFLDIGYSPDIIGGAVIIFQGKYRDFSFKYVFEREFEKERSSIMKIIEK